MNHEQGKAPIDISLLTKEQFDNEIQKGFSDFENGRTFTAEQVQAQLLKNFPVEDIEIDENGHYDPEKHPEFHDWMVNG